MDTSSIIERMELPNRFTKAALRQARALNKPVDGGLIAGREDLRAELIFTIDGADAKDLDDAISLAKSEQGYSLGVHIADVSEYVNENTPLDREAYKRGTSIYFPDCVLPMLPEDISNGVCSLNPSEDKLALSCIMEIDFSGEVNSYRLTETVIKSRRRLTYEDINAMFAGDDFIKAELADIALTLDDMKALANLLYRRRINRGSLDFDLDEAKIILDESGDVLDVVLHRRGVADGIIEEFMLIANETVAKHAMDTGVPFIYRVHEKPDKTKLDELTAFVGMMGYGFKYIGNPQPKTLQKILNKVKESKERDIISRAMLRSLKKARYSHEPLGHFGLAARHYCHFTAPIRRYPDLMAHRLIKGMLHNTITDERKKVYEAAMPELAGFCSEREIAAVEAERTALNMKKCEYMQSRIGAVETGVISGVAQFGIFVRLNNTIEGMVRAASIPGDYYTFDGRNHRMVGKHRGRVFKLGDEARIRVTGVDMTNFNIDFELAEGMGAGNAQKRAGDVTESKKPGKKTRSRAGKKAAIVANKRKT